MKGMKRKFFLKRMWNFVVVMLIPALLLVAVTTYMTLVTQMHRMTQDNERGIEAVRSNISLVLDSVLAQNSYMTGMTRTNMVLNKALKRESLSYTDAIYLRSLGRDLPKVQSAFLIGGSRIAHYLSKMLLSMGVRVTLVENDEEHCRRLSEWLPGALVLYGDGTDQELLASEHFANNDAFVALTGRDEDNLISALYAQQQGIRKVVAKCNRMNYAAVVQAAGLECVVAPKLITVAHILRLVRGLENKEGSVMSALYRLADTDAEAAEFILQENTPHLGVPLKDLSIRKGFLIVALLHENHVVIPSGTTVLSAGDRVIVISHAKGIQTFRDIFQKG